MVETAAAIGIVGTVIVLGVLLSVISKRMGSPLTLLLLFLGILFGPVLKWFDPNNFVNIIQVFVTLALVVVIFDVGYGIKTKGIEKKLKSASSLAFMGVISTMLVITLIGHYIIGFSWLLSALLAALVASTDLTIIAPVLRSLKIDKVLKERIELEATLNSIPAAIIAIVIVSIISLGNVGFDFAIKTFLYHIFVGAGLGALLGYSILKFVRRIALADHPQIISLGAVFLVFAIAELVGSSGIAAALAVGIIFGNAKPSLPKIIKSFGGEMELLLITFVYIILGGLINFGVLVAAGILPIIFVIGVLFSRYLSIRVVAHKESPKVKKILFLSGPRGILCAVLALSYAATFTQLDLLIGLVFATILTTSIMVFFIPRVVGGKKHLSFKKFRRDVNILKRV